MGEICVADQRLSRAHVSGTAYHGLGVIWFIVSQAKPCTAVSFHQVEGHEGPGEWRGQCLTLPQHQSWGTVPFPSAHEFDLWKISVKYRWLCLHMSDPFCLALCPRTLTHVDTASLWLPDQLDLINKTSIGRWIECIEHLFHALSLLGWCISGPSYFLPQPQSLLGNLLSTVLILTKLWEHCFLLLFLHF